MWWWNQEAQDKLKDKRKAKKIGATIRDEASKLAYETARKQAKRSGKHKKQGIRGTVRKIGNKGGEK